MSQSLPDVDLRRPRRAQVISPRNLVLRHGKRILQRGNDANDGAPEQIQPGMERLFSFYVPGLQAGPHGITVDQTITAQSNPEKKVTSTHQFNVQAPRLPWERIAGQNAETSKPADYQQNRVPWLALLLFRPDELQVSSENLADILSDTALKGRVKQDDNKTVSIKASDAASFKRTCNCIPYSADFDDPAARTDAILLQSSLFKALFGKFDQNGNPDADQEFGEVYHFRYLAHIRQIHMDGMAGAAAGESDDHVFSVVICPRTGPLDLSQSTTVIAHLVNIERVGTTPLPIEQEFVAMSSLHSWQYNCLPPDSLDVASAFSKLSIDVLKPPLTAEDVARLSLAFLVGARLSGRLTNGFSLTRYRVQTGEVTAAFMRSPIAPTSNIPAKDPTWPPLSNTGANFQILDQQVNVMDITYSTAWQLGRLLALADQAFMAALTRVRKEIFDIAMNNAQAHLLNTRASENDIPPTYKSRVQVARTIADSVQLLASLARRTSLPNDGLGMVHRWFRHVPPAPNLKYNSADIDAIIDDFLPAAASQVASSIDGDGRQPYNEFNKPYSTDWAVVLKWVMDRYFLAGVPPHYLITDPTLLPMEAVRFFHVDDCWISAMVDGGLSLANHLDRDDDRLRSAMKGAINTYLTTAIPGLGYTPPFPRCGFFMRSELVTKFPDLVVEVEPPQQPGSTPIILRQEIVDHNLMLCLLRTTPSKPDFTNLNFRVPPHQQVFAAARTLNTNEIDVDYKKVYTAEGKVPGVNDVIARTFKRGTAYPGGSIFIWEADGVDVRMLNTENFARDYHCTLKATLDPKVFTEERPTAALMGIQLNEPCWQLQLSQLWSSDRSPAETGDETAGLLPLPRRRPIRDMHTQVRRPQIACAPHPIPRQRYRLTESESIPDLVYPHYRLPYIDSDLWPPGPPDTKIENVPQFQYGIFPVGGSHGQNLTSLPEKQDLVFSIVYSSGPQTCDMKQTEIYVPIGADVDGALMDFYRGSGPAMVNNLRFNIWYADNTRHSLVFVLQPRSSRTEHPTVPTRRIQEMSFVLPGVIVHEYHASTQVKVKVRKEYTNQEVAKEFEVVVGPPG